MSTDSSDLHGLFSLCFISLAFGQNLVSKTFAILNVLRASALKKITMKSMRNMKLWCPYRISGVASNLYAIWIYETAAYGNLNGLTLTIDTRVNNIVIGNVQLYVGRDGSYYITDAWNISSNTN